MKQRKTGWPIEYAHPAVPVKEKFICALIGAVVVVLAILFKKCGGAS